MKISEYELSQAEQWLASLPKLPPLKADPAITDPIRGDLAAMDWKNRCLMRQRAEDTIRELIRRERV